MQHIDAAGALVQVIDVLGDQGQARQAPAQFGDRQVGRIGLGREYLLAPPFVPAPDQRRVVAKGLDRGQARRIEVFPEAGQGIAKGRDATFRRDSGAAEYH